MHLSSIRHTTRMSTNYPAFEASTTTTPAPLISSGGGGGSGGFGHKHKRGVSSSRRTATSGASTAAAGAAPAAVPNKAATMRDQNMAELDPSGFARLLNERLQRVVEDRAAMERLERLMSEVSSRHQGIAEDVVMQLDGFSMSSMAAYKRIATNLSASQMTP